MKNKKVKLFCASLVCVIFITLVYIIFFPKQNKYIPAIDQNIVQQVATELSICFEAKVQIKSIAEIKGGRNLTLRLGLQSSNDALPKSVIFKQSLKEGSNQDQDATERFSRDFASLQFVNSLQTEMPIQPHFYGGSKQFHFILQEDLGKLHSLLETLTKENKQKATDALTRFIISLGRLHASSFGKTEQYFELLKSINPDAPSEQEEQKRALDKMIPKLELFLKQIGMPFTKELKEEAQMVITQAFAPGPFTVFIHGDICPDNVFDDPEHNVSRFIDFEWGAVRNALIEGTFLRMNMPTCANAQTIPEQLLDHLEAIYRQELIKKIPAAQIDKIYFKAYSEACAYWLLRTGVPIAKAAWLKDDMWGKESGRSRVLSYLLTFIKVSKNHNSLPHLRAMAEELLETIEKEWLDAKPMSDFAAFQNDFSSKKN